MSISTTASAFVTQAGTATVDPGFALVPEAVMSAAGLSEGDVVRLTTDSATSTLLVRGASKGSLILTDGGSAKRLATSKASVERVDRVPAQQVVVATEPLVATALQSMGRAGVLLSGRPLTSGMRGVSLRPQTLVSGGFTTEEITSARTAGLARVPGFASASLEVVSVSPEGGTVTKDTVVVVESAQSLADVLDQSVSAVKDTAQAAASTLMGRVRNLTGSQPQSSSPASKRLQDLIDQQQRRHASSSPAGGSSFEAVSARPRPSLGSITKSSVTEVSPDKEFTSYPADASWAEKRLTELPHLKAQAQLLTEWLEMGFQGRAALESFGTKPQTGITLQAPEGSGEVDMVRAVAGKLGLKTLVMPGRMVASLGSNDGLEAISALFAAAKASPSVIVFTDVEAIALAGAETSLLPSLLALVEDALADQVAVVGVTSRFETMSLHLRARGYLEHNVSVGMPDREGRLSMLDSILVGRPLAEDLDRETLSARTPGFVYGDLVALVNEAARLAAHRAHKSGAIEGVSLSMDDFTQALKRVKPSSMGSSSLALGSVTLDDVGGMEDVKKLLVETVIWPLQFQDRYQKFGVEPPRGVLLYGPPGCGKTFLLKAVANTGQANVFVVKGSELMSQFVGASEAGVRDLFARAREASPSIIFFDEIDALAPKRGESSSGDSVGDRVVAALLTEMDGVEELKDVVVIGATNRPELVDPALLRPGRLAQMVYVTPPDEKGRQDILKVASRKMPLAADVRDRMNYLAIKTTGYSSADCDALMNQAALVALREEIAKGSPVDEITWEHLAEAMDEVKPSLVAEQVQRLEDFAKAHAERG